MNQFVVWLASSTSFGVSKNWGPATDPNVLWGYTCSPTAKGLNEMYPEIVKFYIQCEIQVCALGCFFLKRLRWDGMLIVW